MIKKLDIIKEIKSWLFSIIAAVFIAILLNSKVVAKVEVQQSSMENTLFAGQHLIVDKLSYNFRKPKRGDIVIILENAQRGKIADEVAIVINDVKSVFGNVDINYRLIKRVIGIPGDEINIKDGSVYVNDEKLDESYAQGQTFSQEFKLPAKVPDGKVFVLGDNRPVSKDSRKIGLVDYKQVEGRAVFRISPFNKIGKIK